MGWVQFFLAECQSRLYPHMRAKFGCDPTAGSKKTAFKVYNRIIMDVLASSKRPTMGNMLFADDLVLCEESS